MINGVKRAGWEWEQSLPSHHHTSHPSTPTINKLHHRHPSYRPALPLDQRCRHFVRKCCRSKVAMSDTMESSNVLCSILLAQNLPITPNCLLWYCQTAYGTQRGLLLIIIIGWTCLCYWCGSTGQVSQFAPTIESAKTTNNTHMMIGMDVIGRKVS